MRRVQFGISITAEKIREFVGAKGGKEKICRDPVGGEDRELILPRQVWLGVRGNKKEERARTGTKGRKFDSFSCKRPTKKKKCPYEKCDLKKIIGEKKYVKSKIYPRVHGEFRHCQVRGLHLPQQAAR